MKNQITILCFSLCASMVAIGQTEEYSFKRTEALSFPGEMRSPNIPMSIGSFFEIPSSCAKDPKVFIRADRFVFPDASLGKIDSCTLTYLLVDDTVRQMIITLPSALSVKQAGKQASKQFGKPVYHKEGNIYVYSWSVSQRHKDPATVRLEVNEDLASGMMYAEEDD